MKTTITTLFAACIALGNAMAAGPTANITAFSEKSSRTLPVSSQTQKTSQKSTEKKVNSNMNISKKCKDTNLHRAQCMIELILEDISANYESMGGGGISSIKAVSSTSYSVSLPQEERIDIFTYEFEIKSDIVSLKSKVASTQSFNSAPVKEGAKTNK